MSSFAQRLKRYMDHKQYTAYYVNKCAGLSTGLLLKALQNDNNMSSNNIEQILLAFPDLNADWLLTGRGKMLNDRKELPTTEQPLPPDLEASLYRCIIWHLLLQDTYADTMARLDDVLAKLDNVGDRIADLCEQLNRLKTLLKTNYDFQPADHGLYEMSLRIAAGDDGKHTPSQLKEHFDLDKALRKYLDL
jgi:hypothetical protein